MKIKITAVAAAVICIAVTLSGTIAYFTSEDTAHNVITSGGVSIKVIEKTLNGKSQLVDFPKEGIHGVMPGQKVSKIVQVKNTGSADAWIRIRVESEITDSSDKKLEDFLPSGKPVITYSILDGWEDGGDGYYYCKSPVPAGKLTDELFKEVEFEPLMGNEYQNCKANIFIYAEAVQSANNPIPGTGNISDIKGWPQKSEEETSK